MFNFSGLIDFLLNPFCYPRSIEFSTLPLTILAILLFLSFFRKIKFFSGFIWGVGVGRNIIY